MAETFVGLASFSGRNGQGLITAFGAGSVAIEAGDRISPAESTVQGTGTGNPIAPVAPSANVVVQTNAGDLSSFKFVAAVFRNGA
jgi:hypothetical protein